MKFESLAVSAYRGQVSEGVYGALEAIYNNGRELERAFTNINQDGTRTKNEKQPLVAKVARGAKDNAAHILNSVLKGVVDKAESAKTARAFHLHAGSDNVMIAHLATTLMGKKPDEIAALANADARFARALNMFPASVYGIEPKKHEEYLDKAWRTQKPEDAAAYDAAIKDADALVKFGTLVDNYATKMAEQAENAMKAAGRYEE